VVIVTVVIGIILSAVLIIHIFLTNNVVEKDCRELKDGINKYYSKFVTGELEE